MSDELLSQSDGPIHRLTLNRPARRNALTPDLARQLAQEIEQVEEAGEARVIILSGAGGPLLRRAGPPLAQLPAARTQHCRPAARPE